MTDHLPHYAKPHPVCSIYLQINSTQIPKEASKKFHTFVTHRTKWPQGRGREKVGGSLEGGMGVGGCNKTLTDDEVVINV